jgi:hypothetical protein
MAATAITRAFDILGSSPQFVLWGSTSNEAERIDRRRVPSAGRVALGAEQVVALRRDSDELQPGHHAIAEAPGRRHAVRPGQPDHSARTSMSWSG